MSTAENKVGIVLAVILALTAWLLSPEFAFDSFGLSEKTFGIVRLIATGLSIAIVAYNGYQINAKKIR